MQFGFNTGKSDSKGSHKKMISAIYKTTIYSKTLFTETTTDVNDLASS